MTKNCLCYIIFNFWESLIFIDSDLNTHLACNYNYGKQQFVVKVRTGKFLLQQYFVGTILYRAGRAGGAEGAIPPPIFWESYLFSEKSSPKKPKNWVFLSDLPPPNICIAPSIIKKLYRPCYILRNYLQCFQSKRVLPFSTSAE